MRQETCIHVDKTDTIFTRDIPVTEKHVGQEDIVVEIPYSNIRYAGAILQLYYTVGVFEKMQWVPFADYSGVFIHPRELLLPVGPWIERGLRPDSFVRVVFIGTAPE